MRSGREKEWEQLERLYHTDTFCMTAVTGGPGTGKAALVREFVQRKRKFWVTVRDSLPVSNAAGLREAFWVQSGKGVEVTSLPETGNLSRKERVILVIDGAERMAVSFPLLAEWLSITATHPEGLRLLVLFLVPSMAHLRNNLSAAAFRMVGEIRLDRLDFPEAGSFFPCFQPEEQLCLYGAAGGLPEYLGQIANDRSCRENLYQFFFSPDAPYRRIGEERLRACFREPAVYHAVMEAAAGGAVQMQDMAAAVGMGANLLSKYVGSLVEKGFLIREIPAAEAAGGKHHRRTFYRIADPMLHFWYAYVFRQLGNIESGMGAALLRKRVLPTLDGYMQELFLRISLQNLARISGEHAGFYWKGPFRRGAAVLWSENRTARYGAGCFWGKRKADSKEIEALMAMPLPEGTKPVHFVLYSRKGFTDRALSHSAAYPNLRLVSLVYMQTIE